MFEKSLSPFLDTIFSKLAELNIDISTYELDHIGYQASSSSDYDKLLPKFKEIGSQIHEATVGGRRVSIFELKTPFVYKNYLIPAIELVEPKPDQICPSALEHVEFVLTESFEQFLEKYPDIEWDTSAIDQKDFPMIKLKLGDNIQVKFHKEHVLKIAENLNA